MIPIYKPFNNELSKTYAKDAIDSGWWSSIGSYIEKATEKLSQVLGIEGVLLTNNGTSATHLIAKCLAYRSRRRKILVPDNVYVAAWNSFLFDKDYELIPVASDLNTWNYDLSELDKSIHLNPDADLLIVHNLGNIINVPVLKAKYPNLHMVEDNCEGLFGKYNGMMSGTESLCSSISFFGNKSLTSGEGGAFLSKDLELVKLARKIHGQGQTEKRFVHDVLGNNFRITNIQAAILLGQLENKDEILSKKNRIFQKYQEVFSQETGFRLQSKLKNTERAEWMFPLWLDYLTDHEQVQEHFKRSGVETRPCFYSIDSHPHIKNDPKVRSNDTKNARTINQKVFLLPSYPDLTDQEIEVVIRTCLSLRDETKPV